MEKIYKKVPVIFVSNFPSMTSNKQIHTFDIMFTLSTKVRVFGNVAQDPSGQDIVKFRKFKEGQAADEGWEAQLMLTDADMKVNGKFTPLKLEMLASDVKIKNPDWKPVIPDPDGDGPQTGDPGTPDKPEFISTTSDTSVSVLFESLDQGLMYVQIQHTLTVKPKTYDVPQAGLVVGPGLIDTIKTEERAFLVKHKLNRKVDYIKLQDNFKDTIVPTAPTTGNDLIYHTLSFNGPSNNNVFTLDSATTEVRINREEGMVNFRMLNRSNSTKVVKVTNDANAQVDYTVPAADRTTVHLFNLEASFWATEILFLEPKFMKCYKGDVIPFRITNKMEEIGRMEYKIQPEELGIVKSHNLTFHALNPGVGYLEATIYDKYDMLYDIAKIKLFVEDAKNVNPVKIMMHNRKTNRLTTIKGNNKVLKDMVYAFSKETSKGITRDWFYKKENVIAKPIILSPMHNTVDFTGKVISSKFETNFENRRLHVGTVWEFSRDQGFTNIIEKRQKIIGNFVKADMLYDIVPPILNVDIWVRVQYIDSNGVYSPWSDPVMFRAKNHHADVGPTNVANKHNSGLIWDGGYYGEIPYDQTVEYNYRGEFDTLKQHNLTIFKMGMQVLHKGKKWNVKNPMGTATFKEPGTDDNYWELDERNNLPQPRNLVEKYGVAVGMEDRNIDGYSFGQIGIGDIKDPAAAGYDANKDYKGWLYPDTDYKWLKFTNKGKILFVLNKPVCNKIAWNDIAKREAHDGNRTVRLGSHLYRLRMLTLEEYDALLNKTLPSDKNSDEQIGAKWDGEYVCEWTMDEQNKNYKKLVVRTKDKGVEEKRYDPAYRTGYWRPVLEWVPVGTEPMYFLPWLPIANVEDLRYDPITDTGYFGEVDKANFLTYEEVRNQCGITGGTLANNDTSRWCKFYWHGKVIYWTRSYVHNGAVLKNMSETAGIHPNGVSTIVGETKYTKIKNVDFKMGIPTGCKWAIPPASPWNNQIGQYSMHNELFCRVVDKFGSDDSAGGHQIGNSWHEFPLSESRPGTQEIYNAECVTYPDGTSGAVWRWSNSELKTAFSVNTSGGWNDGANHEDCIQLILQSPPSHFYIDQSYYNAYQVLYSNLSLMSPLVNLGGGLSETVLTRMLEELYSRILVFRNDLEQANKMNTNPYNPRTIKENWMYPPCQRYTGGRMPSQFEPTRDLTRKIYNMYFKGAKWEGHGFKSAWAYFMENCLNVDDYGERPGFPFGIANWILFDTVGNEGELQLTHTFDDGSLPDRYLSAVATAGDNLSRHVISYNQLAMFSKKPFIDFV